MSAHKHDHPKPCKHELQMCGKCDVPFCAKCGMEWAAPCTLNHYSWHWNSAPVTPYRPNWWESVRYVSTGDVGTLKGYETVPVTTGTGVDLRGATITNAAHTHEAVA